MNAMKTSKQQIADEKSEIKLLRQLDKGDVVEVELKRNESAWNPACTTCRIWGPARIIYRRFRDGGIEATVHQVG